MRTSILGIIVSAAVGLFAFFGVASPAEAGSVVIFGSGVWDSDVTPGYKAFSAPGSAFAFDFVLPDPIPTNPADGTDFDYDTGQNRTIIDDIPFATRPCAVLSRRRSARVCSICLPKKMIK